MNSEQFGSVISEIRMPVINGYDFIKKSQGNETRVKVFLTTASEIDDVEFEQRITTRQGRRNHSQTDFIRGFHQYGNQAYQ